MRQNVFVALVFFVAIVAAALPVACGPVVVVRPASSTAQRVVSHQSDGRLERIHGITGGVGQYVVVQMRTGETELELTAARPLRGRGARIATDVAFDGRETRMAIDVDDTLLAIDIRGLFTYYTLAGGGRRQSTISRRRRASRMWRFFSLWSWSTCFLSSGSSTWSAIAA